MAKSDPSNDKKFNDALKRALATPPQPHKPHAKKAKPASKKGAAAKKASPKAKGKK